MDDFVVNVRQIGNYPGAASLGPNDLLLVQQNGLGGPYASVTPSSLMQDGLAQGGSIQMKSGYGIEWDANTNQSFHFDANGFTFSSPVNVPVLNVTAIGGLIIDGQIVATQDWVAAQLAAQVVSFNGRTGVVVLNWKDINTALCLEWDDQVASTKWVNSQIWTALQAFYNCNPLVYSFNGRTGNVVLTTQDVNAAYAASAPGVWPTAPNPTLGDASNRIATTLFVDESLSDLEEQLRQEISGVIDLSQYAPLNSPQFSGVPTAPTANPGSATGQLATTAFVMQAVAASTTGVSSFNTRTGAVTLTLTDVENAGGAPIASPALTGTPTAPTAATGVSTTQLATTAFVHAAISAITTGVTSFNTRTGAVTLTTADVTGAGGAPIASPAFTGTVTAPTAAPASNDTTVATTAFVHAAITAAGTAVTSWNGRTGAVTLQANDVSAVGGALVNSPTFTGVPAAPTAAPGTNTTQLATTAFVEAAILASAGGVTSFNTRTGAVTLTNADVTGAGGAPVASPNFTGTPTAPTAAQTVNDTTIATTAYVKAAIAAQSVVTSFNSRTGNITLTGADVSAAGGALLASPTFTGTPSAPTATAGTSSTQLATTAFVTNAIGTTVSSFNGRNGAVTLSGADITGAGGALLASPAFSGTPTAPTPGAGTNNTQLATTAFVMAAISATATPGFTFALSSGASVMTATGSSMTLSSPGTINLNNTVAINAADLYLASASGNVSARWLVAGSQKGVIYFDTATGYFRLQNTSGGDASTVNIVNTNMVQLGKGFFGLQGNSGGAYGATHNFFWTGSTVQMWVDVTLIGPISSDYRVKKDIIDLPGMWGTVKRLRPIKYTYKDFSPPSQIKYHDEQLARAARLPADQAKALRDTISDKPLFHGDDVEHWGFIAHELQDTLVMDAASGVKDAPDCIQSPNPLTILAALTKALQECMVRIEALESRTN